MTDVTDLRGRKKPPPPDDMVLTDPSGRRARVLRMLARLLAVGLLLWLMGLILAGLGVLPGHRIAPRALVSADPPALHSAPPAVQAPASRKAHVHAAKAAGKTARTRRPATHTATTTRRTLRSSPQRRKATHSASRPKLRTSSQRRQPTGFTLPVRIPRL